MVDLRAGGAVGFLHVELGGGVRGGERAKRRVSILYS